MARARSRAGRYLITVPDEPYPRYHGPMVSNAQNCQSDAKRLYGPTAFATPWRKVPAGIKRGMQR